MIWVPGWWLTGRTSLWWPLSDAAVQVPYWWYALAILAAMPP